MKKQTKKFIISAVAIILTAITILQESGMHKLASRFFFPGITSLYAEKTNPSILKLGLQKLFPLYQYANKQETSHTKVEDNFLYEMILALQNKEEEIPKEDLNADMTETGGQIQDYEVLLEKLQDFNYLLSNYYTVDSTTTIGADQLNVDALLGKNMQINTTTKGPKVLIYHTHSQETFADSKPGDVNTSIVGIGAFLAEQLKQKGIETIHHKGVYDLINGKLDRSKAYELAEVEIRKILKQYPTIEVVIDLHRDGVPENMHLVTNVNGKQTAKIMFFNGLSRTKTNGDIAYLKNPYIADNLAFSFQMQLQAQSMYEGFTRRIYLRGYRYSMHLMPKTLLVEAGAQTNTVQEMKNAMELLANILYKVLL